MISEKMYDLFQLYQIGSRAKLVALDDPRGNALFYYIYQPPIISCLSEQTEFYPDGTLKKLRLDQHKIGQNKIFQPAWILENFLIVDSEILELLLIEAIYPFCYEELPIVKDKER